MTLLSNEQKKRLHKLYSEQRFSELELEIEMISDPKTRSAFLSNLLGVSKLRKKDGDKDWISARDLFLDAHNKDKNYIDALCNYAHVCVKLRDYDGALNKLIEERKKKYNPKINEALARIYFFEGEIDKVLNIFKETADNNDLNRVTASHYLSSLNYSPNFSQKDYLKYCTKIESNLAVAEDQLAKLVDLDLSDEIKIGFVSPDFKEHSVYYFLKGTIDALRRKKFRVLLFNLRNPDELDNISQNMKEDCDEWVNIHNLNDLDAANLIRKKRINILIDITGHFSRNRISIFKFKPSPIQISWMGYVNSTGVKEIDYIISDKNLIKKGEENLYSEEVLKLDTIWNCHKGFDEKIEPSSLPYLKNGYITFGCFNNTVKISDRCINVWSKILNEIEGAKLIIKAVSKDAEIAQNKILDKFSKNNVDIKRINFEKSKKERIDHLKMYREIDVSLDTFPYPGVTTSFESIWMGVPVLTKKGEDFVSRCGESINLNLGLKDFIAENEDDYVAKAVLLNSKKKDLSKIRNSLRQNAINSPLFDTDLFGKEFSSIIKNVWDKYLTRKDSK